MDGRAAEFPVLKCALWDLAGKAYGVPAYQLAGRKIPR